MTAEPAAYLAGATASGKSAEAVRLARALGLAIVSCDALQVYRGIEIGTAQPLESERGGVPHHLLGCSDVAEEWHAARFAREAREAIEAEARAGRRCLVVGGTGLWLRALREGLFDGPGRDEELRRELRAVLAERGPGGLHALLAEEDPEAAAALRPADHVRVLRALEVWRLTGRSIADWQREDAARRGALGPLPPLFVLQRPRGELHARIAARVDRMLADGWLAEAGRLRERALPEHAPPSKALGYRELSAVLDGRATLAEVRERIVAGTRQFARRQETWFRAERGAVAAGPGCAELEALLSR
ncbi:MAG: tRNA (adenosine(37)-N6)-dimethylallyltransferase MiaA [Candidatus Sumerlaeia bacterium]|nr:tRNA (adenosine(37)-N6)-dimethylallyltransferase MiaA [Candidatus Sumerlaeia bacterium]